MKRLFNVALLLVCVLFVQDSRAQDYTRWGLPEGAIARFGRSSISEMAYSPDGARLAVASGIGIWIYNAPLGAEVALLTGHSGRVLTVSFSSDGTMLASGGKDGTIRLWDMSNWQSQATLGVAWGFCPFRSVFTRRHHPSQWAWGRHGSAVGRSHRRLQGHFGGEYVWGFFRGVFAEWHHAGQWTWGRHGSAVGRKYRPPAGRSRRAPAAYLFRGVFARWQNAGQWKS